jgi:hypothetical protein
MTGRSQHGRSESVVAPLPCDKAPASGEVGHSNGSWLEFATSHSAAPHNNRIHLTRWPVTALAEKHRRQNHRLGLQGPRQPQLAGDANVSRECAS